MSVLPHLTNGRDGAWSPRARAERVTQFKPVGIDPVMGVTVGVF